MAGNHLYELKGRVPLFKALPFSLQQVLAMFVTNLVPIGVMAYSCTPVLSDAETLVLIQNAMVAAGIATMLQATPVWRIGSGLPIFMGLSFTFIAAMATVGCTYGYGGIIGCVIVGGFFEGILGLTARYWKRIVSPIVSAVVVTGIGLSLLGTATRSFGGGYTVDFGTIPSLVIGGVTLLACLLWMAFIKRTKKQLAILVGITAGFITALFFGKVDLSHILDNGWFALPKILPYKPIFRADAIISVCIIYLVSATETIGDATALVSGALHREITPEEMSGVLAADGFGSMIGGFLGATPVTSYSENVGLTIMTGVVNRNVARIGAGIMILCGLFPPIGQIVRSIPTPVIGGVLLMVIGQILVSGFQMIATAGFTARNRLISALSLAVGIGFTTSTELGIWDPFPVEVQTIFSQNVVAVVFVIAMVMNLLLPKNMEE